MGPLLRQMVLESLTMPKTAAKRLENISLNSNEMFQVAVVVSILNTLAITALLLAYQSMEGFEELAVIEHRPILSAVMHLAQMYFVAICIERIGQMFGGKGTMERALQAVVFLQFVSTLWLVAILFLIHVTVPLAVLLTLGFVYWTFWALACFVAVLHGFESVLNTLVGVIVFGLLVMLILVLVNSIVLNATGLAPTGAV